MAESWISILLEDYKREQGMLMKVPFYFSGNPGQHDKNLIKKYAWKAMLNKQKGT